MMSSTRPADGVTRADMVIVCIMAALSGLVASKTAIAGVLIFLFLSGIFLAVRLTRGRRFSQRSVIVALAFVIPILAAGLLTRL